MRGRRGWCGHTRVPRLPPLCPHAVGTRQARAGGTHRNRNRFFPNLQARANAVLGDVLHLGGRQCAEREPRGEACAGNHHGGRRLSVQHTQHVRALAHFELQMSKQKKGAVGSTTLAKKKGSQKALFCSGLSHCPKTNTQAQYPTIDGRPACFSRFFFHPALFLVQPASFVCPGPYPSSDRNGSLRPPHCRL